MCFLYFNPKDCVAQLGKVLAEKPDEGATTNGQVFDREAYLRFVPCLIASVPHNSKAYLRLT